MTPLGAVITLLLALAVLFLSRQWAMLGVMAAVCYITQGQQFVFLGFNFTAIRFVLLAGAVRLCVRGELRKLEFNGIDWSIIAYAASVTCIYTLRRGTSSSFIYQLGCSYDVILSYFVFRGLFVHYRDVEQFLTRLAILIVPFGLSMIVEFATGRNIFDTLFGGLGESTMREGRFRAQASFRHAITAGVFGASLMPLFVGLYRAANQRRIASIGLVVSGTIVLSSNSSGPLLAFYTCLVALACWPLRQSMRSVRRGILATLIGLHLIMKAPVWYIFSKISGFTGGHGWHRSEVIDQAIRHFPDWCLLGTDKASTWSIGEADLDWADLTNEYVNVGVQGGMVSMILFIMILVRCFRNLGTAMGTLRQHNDAEHGDATEKLLWCIGVGLTVHTVSFFSVSYFDQMRVAWWVLPAIISSFTSDILKNEPANEAAQSPQPLREETVAP